MVNQERVRTKRKIQEPLETEVVEPKRPRSDIPIKGAGKIAKILVRNFFCHELLEVDFNPSVNFIVGKNGSGKSAILAALTVGLGARASITRRGDSHKTMIKTGKTSATIEITLTNNGPGAFQPEKYGDSIKVVRTISLTSSSYALKNSAGKLVSKKKADLDQAISFLKIQVDNPVSVLNQDSAKDFLLQANSAKKYELFMKATQLETIGNNYKEALQTSKASKEHLEETAKQMKHEKQQIQQLELNISRLDSVERDQLYLEQLQSELLWSNAIKEENKLKMYENELAKNEEQLSNLLNNENAEETRINQINIDLKDLDSQKKTIEEQINKAREKVREKRIALETAQDKLNKHRQTIKTGRTRIQRNENSLQQFTAALNSALEGTGQAATERNTLIQAKTEAEEEHKIIQSSLVARKVEVDNLDNTRRQMNEEIADYNKQYETINKKIMSLKSQLRSCESQKGNALSVWHSDMPRFVRRIQEEVRRGRIKKQPIGPVGAYLKIRDPQWTPAVEKLLNKSTLMTFCVDNNNDAQVIKGLIEEVFATSTNRPNIRIYCSEFLDAVHDIRSNRVQSQEYSSLLDTMEITNANVTNYLIDSFGIERILLIPTSRECTEILKHIQTVPKNCFKAITKTGDTFYPQPQYRTYGGSVRRPQFLEVSTTEKIQSFKNEMEELDKQLKFVYSENQKLRQKRDGIDERYSVISAEMNRFKGMQTRLKNKIEDCTEQLNALTDSDQNIGVYRDEIAQFEAKIATDKEAEKQLLDAKVELDTQRTNAHEIFEEQQKILTDLEKQISPIKNKIKQLGDEKIKLDVDSRYATKRVQDTRKKVQEITAEVETQRRVTEKSVNEAEKHCLRVDTKRSASEIKKMSSQLKAEIDAVKRELGNREQLFKQLNELRTKHGGIIEFFQKLNETNEKHLERVAQRKHHWSRMKKEMGFQIENAFESILQLRGYRGWIKIDHRDKKLDLEVTPQNTQERAVNDAKTLSGGERSYSTVAFILALWECTSVPFYFMDEFDVFMDKINRRMVMDCLLEHARTHRQCQFGFLTPLDASIVTANENLKIHRMHNPEREQEQQEQS
ncbi:hypothetical protein HCN44_008346 [Aphidius gifuensis]|uniref:Rad50/SbcC-type AAA domain-containing protein n=1 Tax=Aphidius gifuensis TaxID=684658 RepID=A0A835CMX2_APHGI|nr:structural maintenance of chromosomes protein 6 [Aphidius gifuensis]XP_044016651.1 structural maintenance of chromosomes protein 6 [Aphidius gifuensis]KAF7989672.1 hypothetical protein HCN44_008346 [Aphidius gifuensis]